MASRTPGQQQALPVPGAVFQEPASEGQIRLQLVDVAPEPSQPHSATAAPPEAGKPERAPRRRILDPDILSSKPDDNTQWRLSLYCRITGYGVKDAVVKAATGYLGLGPYPRRLPPARVRLAKDQVPFVVNDRRKGISVRLDPELMEQVRADVVGREINQSAWAQEALTAFFDQQGLPTRISD